jgi:hypothetical protein
VFVTGNEAAPKKKVKARIRDSFQVRIQAWSSLPKRRRSLVKRLTVFARYLAWFVSIMTLDNRLSQAARFGQVLALYLTTRASYAFVLYMPQSHLLEKIPLVALVSSPTHVEDVWFHFPLHHLLHELRATMIVKATRKFFGSFHT